MSDWRDIRTAPKDGTKIDLWVVFPDGGRRWPDASWKLAGQTAFSGPDNWASQDGVPLHGLVDRPVATHWMPPPAPPAA